MILETVSITLSIISVTLAIVAIYYSMKVNKETSNFLIEIKTYSKNINEKAMAWLEQLIFNPTKTKESTSSTKEKKDTDKPKTTEADLVNYLYNNKEATRADIMKDLQLDFATSVFLIRRLRFSGIISFYEDKNGRDIYFLVGYKDDAELKYPKKEKELLSNIPF